MLCLLIYSGYKIYIWNKENYKTKKIQKTVLKNIKIKEITPDKNNNITSESIYFKYKDVSFIDVDIKSLKKENPDTIGWIQVLGTDINYPIVQKNNNDYYLKHNYLKEYSTGGWIFLDYRNNINDLSQNNVIYGHRRQNKSMFGTLKNVLTDTWLNNENNYLIKIATEKQSYVFQIFSIYTIPNETYYIQTSFNSADFQTFIKTITNRSKYDFHTEVLDNDKLLTLSTCYSNNDRLVVHAKLINSMIKDSYESSFFYTNY